MVYVAGITIALFIEILLITKKGKTSPDKLLAIWMLVILVHLFAFYFFSAGYILGFPSLLGTEQPLPLFHGVLLFLYVSTLTKQVPRKKSLLALHFLPIVVTYAFLMPFFTLPVDQKMEIYRNHGAGYPWFFMVTAPAMSVYGLFYVIWSAFLLRKHERNVRNRFSDLGKIDLRWLRFLTYGLGVIWLLVVCFRYDPLTFSGVAVFVFLIGFFGIRQAEIFNHGLLQPGSEEEREKYPKSGLTEKAAAEIHEALIRRMAENALYKEPGLSIDDLSVKLGVHPNYLSQVINQIEKKNFYDFVNTYRVEEFKRLIAMPRNRNLTLLSVAFACGFNSKSSFNRYFKKATGQTPSGYFSALSKEQGNSSL